MVNWLYAVILAQAVLIGSFLLVAGLAGKKPSGKLILLLASVEVSLLTQLAVSLGMVLAGQSAKISTIEFFGYLIVAILIPPAAVIWSVAESNRWSTVVLGFSSLTIAIMLVRMQQIWTGDYFGAGS